MLTYSRRFPALSVPESDRLLFGLSHARGLFERFGLCREDMRTAVGYSYMTDEEVLRLEKLPRGREYVSPASSPP